MKEGDGKKSAAPKEIRARERQNSAEESSVT